MVILILHLALVCSSGLAANFSGNNFSVGEEVDLLLAYVPPDCNVKIDLLFFFNEFFVLLGFLVVHFVNYFAFGLFYSRFMF